MKPRVLSVALLACALTARAASAQTAGRTQGNGSARLVAFTNEPQQPEFGEVFPLHLTVRLAPGVVAFFPDTLLPAASAFSAGPGEWSASPGPSDSVDVHATYPVMGLMNGGVELPSLELWTRPVAADEAGGPKAAASLATPPVEGTSGLEHVVLYVGGVPILPLREMAAAEDALVPRPAADVEGGNWSGGVFAALALLGLAAALLAGALASRAHRAAAGPDVPAPPELTTRASALRELDRIHELAWHRNGRVVDFYDATTGVLRRYSGREEPEGGVALTSSELMDCLRGRWGEGAISALGAAVWAAECVKFGDYRPAAEAAELDWSTVRDWIEHGSDP
jgi:hypothetical protein